MHKSENPHLESDPRFPTGPWTGFFLQPPLPGRQQMELHLTFVQGTMTGEGRDWVGKFVIRGRYELEDGKCHFHKRYLGKHDVYYTGYNEGKGIWGTWEIPPEQNSGMHATGGFHIWPEGMDDPTQPHLMEEADLLITVEELDELPVGTA